jgi:aspartate/methionine/tyrosine aminotransferase
MLPRVEYIEWIQGRPAQARHDLATSDLEVERARVDQVVPSVLEGLSDPREAVDLDEQVADAYGVAPANVVVTAGATHAYVLAVAAALDGEDGDRVLVERPGYEPLRRTPEAMGATLHRFVRPPADGYPLVPERVRNATTEDTAVVVATNRHNPSGRLAGEAALAEAAAAAREEGSRLLVDEVYAPYTGTATEGAFGGPTAAMRDGAVVTGSLTKFHGLGGLRIGWVVADEAFLERVRTAFAYLPVRAAPSVTLARRALESGDAIATRSRERLRANHDLLASFVAEREDVDAMVDDESPFGFLAHEGVDGDAVADAAWQRDLLVVPGRFFEEDDRFRVSLGGDPEEMAAALDVLGETLDAL